MTRRPLRADYHDPTAGLGGAPPARSALQLRLVLAGFGMLVCTAGAAAAAAVAVWPLCIVLGVLAAVALIDLFVILRRMGRGDPYP